jgi:type IV fimbrial biogenesis protein FimT
VGGRRRARADRSGFTLVELVVVLALLGLLIVLAVPAYISYISNQRLIAAAQTLVADLRMARQEAVTRRATVIVTFAVADAACLAARAPASASASYTVHYGTTVIKRTCLPADLGWGADSPRAAAFQSVGTAVAPATVTVRSQRTGREHAVTVAAESGAVTDAPR